MRMWMVDPAIMCAQHLLGEHVECHMFVGTLNAGKSVDGYVQGGLLEVHSLRRRHQQLVKEMKRRGMHHRSELPKFLVRRVGQVDGAANLIELKRRCLKCKRLQKNLGIKAGHNLPTKEA